MKRRFVIAALVAIGAMRAPTADAQSAEPAPAADRQAAKKGKKSGEDRTLRGDLSDTAALSRRERKANEVAARFWDQPTPLEVVLTADMKQLRGDKTAAAPWRPATISYAGRDGGRIAVPLQVRTRGVWRLKHCRFPPLRLNFAEKGAKGTVFEGVNKPKMVSVCTDDDRSERYVLQELQLYRVHGLLTEASHKVRLLRIKYADAGGDTIMTRWAFLIEEPEAVADRLRGALVEERGARGADLEPRASAVMGVFQYFIGNADFSLPGLHNVELVRVAYGVHVPVAYDFDFAGAVNAWYAKPPAQLRIKRVTERVFRGECTPPQDLHAAVALLHAKKPEIRSLYSDAIGRLLPPNVTAETLRYFDEFYALTANPGAVERRIVNACLGAP